MRHLYPPKHAMAALTEAMKADPEYAWSWHCNIAMVAVDAGAPHQEANERAAGFMRTAFDVDTRSSPHFPKRDITLRVPKGVA